MQHHGENILLLASKAVEKREKAALVTVIACTGSTPRKPGTRMLVYLDGRIAGTIGGGQVEYKIIQFAQNIIKQKSSEIINYKLTAELAMCCGGQMTFFVEPIMTKPTLFVMGCGHIGKALIECAMPLDFEIYAIDSMEDNANPQRLPQASRFIHSYDVSALEELPFGIDTYVIIATREHRIDQQLLEFCLKKESAFIGCIGSDRKALMQQDRLRAKGYDTNNLERIHCPVGLKISAQTPEEIAVAICAQIIEFRNKAPQVT